MMENSKVKSVCQVRIINCNFQTPRIVINAMRGSQPVEYGSPLMFIPNVNTDLYRYLCYIYFVVRIKRYFTISVDVYLDSPHYGLASDHQELLNNSVYFIFERTDDTKEK